jgi:hypothetical protein
MERGVVPLLPPELSLDAKFHCGPTVVYATDSIAQSVRDPRSEQVIECWPEANILLSDRNVERALVFEASLMLHAPWRVDHVFIKACLSLTGVTAHSSHGKLQKSVNVASKKRTIAMRYVAACLPDKERVLHSYDNFR